ncbi:MAG: sigma-70 family RNA polymerase sigma factor [Anaerolineae bacterium]|nr:sigma-70 family RNA polymerase sigma factor [Chloroflexota bacterium]MBP6298723.1 sigma-70 family RNA polymerase sigma factor [Anaerolineae bacterium]
MASEPLIQRGQRGDRDAIAELYELYVERIFRYVSYRVEGAADIQDLTAEVFVKMVEGLPKYRNSGIPFEAWLYRIASARIIDYRRRIQRRPQSELTESLTDDFDETPEEAMVEQEELETLRRAIGHLNEEQQTLLVLRFIERKSHDQVAAIMGKSVSAVKSIQHRALNQLAAQLGETKVRHYLRGSSDDQS